MSVIIHIHNSIIYFEFFNLLAFSFDLCYDMILIKNMVNVFFLSFLLLNPFTIVILLAIYLGPLGHKFEQNQISISS